MNTMIDDFMLKNLTDSNNRKELDRTVPPPVLVPLMYLERFSDWAGVPKSVILEKLDTGHIPIIVVERRKMVNLSLLRKMFAGS